MPDASQTKKILVVEDEAALLRVLSDKLRREGFEVTEASDGLQGLEAAFSQHPHLILFDIIMPHMDGLTMLKRLREDPWGRYVPVVILTNVNDTAKVMETVELGLADGPGMQPEEIFSGTATDGIKRYLEARLGEGTYEFMAKSNWKIADVVARVKEKLGVKEI